MRTRSTALQAARYDHGMRSSSILLTSLLCTSSSFVVSGFVTAPFFEPMVRGGDGEHEEQSIEEPLARESLVGRVLHLHPSRHDPSLAGRSIYLLADDESGSLGVMIDRWTGELVRQDESGAPVLVREPWQLGERWPRLPLWDGGPVGRDHVFLLHDDFTHAGSLILGDVAVAADPALIDQVLEGRGPENARLFVGYVGWGPGQLAAEIDAGAWFVLESSLSSLLMN